MIIELDNTLFVSFNKENFLPGSYLWRKDNRIIISFIASREQNRGSLSKLFHEIWRNGFEIAIPAPLGRMHSILLHYGFEKDKSQSEVELWVRAMPVKT